jgi:hypothetical protein
MMFLPCFRETGQSGTEKVFAKAAQLAAKYIFPPKLF